jgi:hypothetical protein
VFCCQKRDRVTVALGLFFSGRMIKIKPFHKRNSGNIK